MDDPLLDTIFCSPAVESPEWPAATDDPSTIYLLSSRDSGYGSKSTTPEKTSPQDPLYAHPCCLDGNGRELPSLEDSVDSDDVDNDSVDNDSIYNDSVDKDSARSANRQFASPPQTPTKSIIGPIRLKPNSLSSRLRFPRNAVHSRLPAAFFSTPSPRRLSQRFRSDSTLSSPSSPFTSFSHPDRFVHFRGGKHFGLPLAERFHLTRSADELSPAEKILRSSRDTEDVFAASSSRFRHSSTNPTELASQSVTAGLPPLMRGTTTLGTMDINSDLDPATSRRRGASAWPNRSASVPAGAINDGRGRFIQSGTNAPYFTSSFLHNPSSGTDDSKHKGRLAMALDMDLASRVLPCNLSENVRIPTPKATSRRSRHKKTSWDGAQWVMDAPNAEEAPKQKERQVLRPLRILSAPNLRDDFYCSTLAYSPSSETIAVGLGDLLYRWCEDDGAKLLNGSNTGSTWLTALSFSSTQGGKSILAFGRSNGMLGFLSMHEGGISRMIIQEAAPISCLSWRPTYTLRPSKNPHRPNRMVKTEDLLVGDDVGNVMCYVVEWPSTWEAESDNWRGELTLVARISVHYQQICGLAWSINGRSFATGGNDNQCCFFHAEDTFPDENRKDDAPNRKAHGQDLISDAGSRLRVILPSGSQVRERARHRDTNVRVLSPGMENWRWDHGAAVKAIAFCPWQEGLVATGGGSNDRCIHFFHTKTGAALATIFVSSQVTSLIWSPTRREIAATFGFAHPFHPIRIAVYSWPDCKQVVAIPWEGKPRALCGISCAKRPYYTGKNAQLKRAHQDDGNQAVRTLKEGCVAISSSDESIQFYELWPSDDMPVTGGTGMLGGSDILEDMEGIHKEGDIIR